MDDVRAFPARISLGLHIRRSRQACWRTPFRVLLLTRDKMVRHAMLIVGFTVNKLKRAIRPWTRANTIPNCQTTSTARALASTCSAPDYGLT